MAEAAPLLVAFARGLAAIHATCILHRDVEARERHADVARRRHAGGVPRLRHRAQRAASVTTAVTVINLAGTLPHLPREALRGEAIDARADVYARRARLRGQRVPAAGRRSCRCRRDDDDRVRPPRRLRKIERHDVSRLVMLPAPLPGGRCSRACCRPTARSDRRSCRRSSTSSSATSATPRARQIATWARRPAPRRGARPQRRARGRGLRPRAGARRAVRAGAESSRSRYRCPTPRSCARTATAARWCGRALPRPPDHRGRTGRPRRRPHARAVPGGRRQRGGDRRERAGQARVRRGGGRGATDVRRRGRGARAPARRRRSRARSRDARRPRRAGWSTPATVARSTSRAAPPGCPTTASRLQAFRGDHADRGGDRASPRRRRLPRRTPREQSGRRIRLAVYGPGGDAVATANVAGVRDRHRRPRGSTSRVVFPEARLFDARHAPLAVIGADRRGRDRAAVRRRRVDRERARRGRCCCPGRPLWPARDLPGATAAR